MHARTSIKYINQHQEIAAGYFHFILTFNSGITSYYVLLLKLQNHLLNAVRDV